MGRPSRAADWRRRITDKQLRAAVEIPAGFDAALERGTPAEVKIYDYDGELRSGFAVGELRNFLNDYREKIITARLTGRGLPAARQGFQEGAQKCVPSHDLNGLHQPLPPGILLDPL